MRVTYVRNHYYTAGDFMGTGFGLLLFHGRANSFAVSGSCGDINNQSVTWPSIVRLRHNYGLVYRQQRRVLRPMRG